MFGIVTVIVDRSTHDGLLRAGSLVRFIFYLLLDQPRKDETWIRFSMNNLRVNVKLTEVETYLIVKTIPYG